MKWKKTQSKNIKPSVEGWFINWKKGKRNIEIIRHYDDEKEKEEFEVWKQIERPDDSWDGTYLASFPTTSKAVNYVKKNLKKVI